MNCSPVTIKGTSTSFTGPRIFEANIFGAGTCNTVEGVDIVYPNPGASVAFGGAFVGGNTGPPTVLANCNFDQNVNLTTNGGTVTSEPAPVSHNPSPVNDTNPSSSVSKEDHATTTAAAAKPDPTTDVPTTTTPATKIGAAATSRSTTSNPETATPVPAVISNSSTSPSGAGPSGPCTDMGAIHCSSDGKYFSMCSNGQLISMGSVAAGTSCVNGAIVKRWTPPQLHRRGAFWK
jgi:hypothetical protein